MTSLCGHQNAATDTKFQVCWQNWLESLVSKTDVMNLV